MKLAREKLKQIIQEELQNMPDTKTFKGGREPRIRDRAIAESK
jgi:hypothetical protein